MEQVRQELVGSKVLITGGAGFVGGSLTRKLLELDIDELIIVDNFLSSNPSSVPIDDRIQLIQGSIADPIVLRRLPKDLDYVWHLACYHGNQSSIANPLDDHLNNSLTSLMLFEHLSTYSKGVKKVVYSAAGCAVAEKTADNPKATQEDAPISAFHDSPYSISKIVGELYGNYFFSSTGLPFVRARFQNVYGPGETLGAGQWRGTPATVWRNVVPNFIWRALNNSDIVLENGGLGSRDFIFVEDIVEGLISCAALGRPGEAYNLATGQEVLIKELARIVLELCQSGSRLVHLPKRDWDNSIRRFGSTEKSLQELGFQAKFSIDEGILQTVTWTQQNFDIVRQSISKHDFMMSRLDQ